MNKLACLVILLAVTGPAAGDDVASTVQGGIGVVWREPSDNPPFDQLRLDYDSGTQVHLEVASHYRYALLLRLGYAYTLYDELTALGSLAVAEDIETHEARIGAFHAPFTRGPVGYRIGGGYVYHAEDTDRPSQDRNQDGGFVEAGLVIDAGRHLTFDLAALGLKVEGEDDYDADGAEGRATAILHTGPLDVTLGLRYLKLNREAPFDETLTELRLGIGGAWGYPEN